MINKIKKIKIKSYIRSQTGYKGVVINYRGVCVCGYKTEGGEASEVLPLKKGAGGRGVSILKGVHTCFWGSFYKGA